MLFDALSEVSDVIRLEFKACFSVSKMFRHISYIKNGLSVGKYLYSANSIGKIDQNIREQKIMRFEDVPGPRSYPLIGTLHKYLPILGDYSAESLDKNAYLNWRRYGSLVREVPLVKLLHVFDPEHIEAVFRQDDRYPARRSHVAMYHYRVHKPHVYNTGGLLSTNGPDWWRLRSTFQKNFTSPQSVRDHIHNTDKVTRDFIQWIQEQKVSENDDFLPYLNRLNLEVIGKVAFNESFDSFSENEQDEESRSSKVIAAAFDSNSGIMKLDKGFLWKLFQTPLYKKLANSQEYLENYPGICLDKNHTSHLSITTVLVHSASISDTAKTLKLNEYNKSLGSRVSTNILIQRVSFFETESHDSDNSLLASFLKQDKLDLKDIVGMMVDILMAAIDTTAFSTSFALYHLARNPKVQEKIYSEVKSLLPHEDSEITAETLTKAVYVRSCIKESLRLNPVSIGVGRLLQKDAVIGGYLIPSGTVIVTQNMIASRLPQFVRDPLSFKPERWQRSSCHYENIHPFTSLPFGFGPRSCIARRLAEQNMNMFIIRLLRQFEIKWIGDDLGVQTHLINKPDQPVTFSFTPRPK